MTTGTGTGTPATTPATVTAQDLIDAIQVSLDDAAETAFDEDELLVWLNEAVREYSQHFPRAAEVTITAEEGETRYSLPLDATAIIGVTYPAGAEPPDWLERRSRRSAGFAGALAYDVEWTRDLTAAPALLLGFAPAAGASLAVRIVRPHDSALSAADHVTVPAEHHHILLQYVLFAAARHLQAREQAAPTNNSSLLMAQLASNARRLELAYLNALNRILTQRLGEGEVIVWDKWA